MGFTNDVTEYLDMIKEYSRRGAAMLDARIARNNFNYSSSSYSTDDRKTERSYRPSSYTEWEYPCQAIGCDGMTCGH